MKSKLILWIIGILILISFVSAHDYTPLHNYHFNDNYTDTTPQTANDLSPQDSPTFTTGKLNNAVEFDSSYATTTLNNASKINTITYWYYPKVINDDDFILYFDGTQNTYNTLEGSAFRMRYDGDWGTSRLEYSPKLNAWAHICMVFRNGTSAQLYVNGTLVDSKSKNSFIQEDTLTFYLSSDTAGNREFRGIIDELSFWEEGFNKNDCEYEWNAGAGREWNGVIPTPDPVITESYNTETYENKTENILVRFEHYNITSNSNATLIYNNTEYNGIINHIDNNNVTFEFNITAPKVYSDETDVYFNWSYALEYANLTYEYGNTSTKNQTINWNLSVYPRINLTVSDALTDLAITNFTVNGTYSIDGSYYLQQEVGTYEYIVTAPAYELKYVNISFSENNLTEVNVKLYTKNSINIQVKDEATNSLITDNITIRFYSEEYGETINYTSTGTLYAENLTASEYQITFSGLNYDSRTYIVTISENTSQQLIAYLQTNLSSTIFTFRDQDTNEILEDVLISMYRNINGSWLTVESQYSDITGKAEFNYIAGANYKFFASKDLYTDYVFYLEPVLFSEYDVKLEKTVLLEEAGDYQGVSIIYDPYSYKNNFNNTFIFIIQSPAGELSYYGYNITTPTELVTNAGTNAIGGQLSSTIEVTGADYYDKVIIDYWYYTSLSGRRDFKVSFPIIDIEEGNNTFISNRDKKYGLGLLERVLIVTIIAIFVIGIATLVGKPIEGMGLALFVLGYMAYIGFIEKWAVLVSIVVGVFFLSWKSGG